MEKDSIELSLPENSNRSLFGVYFKIILIPVVIFAGFLLGYLKIINFKVELHSILMMGILLIIALFLARHNAEYGCLLFEDRIDNFKKDLKNYIMSNLLIIGDKKKSDSSFDSFIGEKSAELRNDNYSSVAAGVFPMLGILGTFISIAISMPEFSSTNINSLETEIAELLGGVGTAFYVSIYGIFLAIWWIYFEKKGLSRFERLIAKYKNSTKNFFWDRDEITRAYFQEISTKNSKMIQGLAHITNSEFSENLNKLIQKKFENFSEILDIEKDSLKITTKEFDKITSVLASNDFNKMNDGFKDILTTLKEVSSELKEVKNSIISESNLKEDRVSNAAASLLLEIKKFEDSIKINSKNILNKQNESFDAFRRDIANFNSKTGGRIFGDNSDVIEELRKSLANIDKKVKFDDEK